MHSHSNGNNFWQPLYMIASGANPKVVQEIMGHARFETTEIYTHVIANRIYDEAEKHRFDLKETGRKSGRILVAKSGRKGGNLPYFAEKRKRGFGV